MRTNPICCYCGYEFDDEETWYGDIDPSNGGDEDVKCPSMICGKTISVHCEYVPTFTVSIPESEDDL